MDTTADTAAHAGRNTRERHRSPPVSLFPAASMSALETLNFARAARGSGDIAVCVDLAERAYDEAGDEKDRETAYHACACVGRAYMGRGEPEKAIPAFTAALGEAKGGLPRWLPQAHHDLYLALRESGNGWRAKMHAGTALDLYHDFQNRSPGMTGLTADLAQGVCDSRPTCEESAKHALMTWLIVPYVISTPLYRLNSAAQAMKASAMLRDTKRFSAALLALGEFREAMPDGEHVARTLTCAASAALEMRDYPLALQLSADSEWLARSRGEDRIAEEAGRLMDLAKAEKTPAGPG